MATVTAHIMMGRPHLYDGGVRPLGQVFLYERERPEWEGYQKDGGVMRPVPSRWRASGDRTLDDGLLMLAALVYRDETVRGLLKRQNADWDRDPLDLTEFAPGDRTEIYDAVRRIELLPKIVVSVLPGSCIHHQLDRLVGYPYPELDICTVTGTRRGRSGTQYVTDTRRHAAENPGRRGGTRRQAADGTAGAVVQAGEIVTADGGIGDSRLKRQ